MPRKNLKTNKGLTDAKKIQECSKLLVKVQAMVGDSPALTTTDRKRSTKLRKGGETVIPTIAALCERFGVQVASHPVDAMLAKSEQARSLIPLHKQMVVVLKNIEDIIFQANSESWLSASVGYATLRRLAKTDGDLQTALEPVAEFFAKRGRRTKVKAPKGTDTGHAVTAQPSASPATPSSTQA